MSRNFSGSLTKILKFIDLLILIRIFYDTESEILTKNLVKDFAFLPNATIYRRVTILKNEKFISSANDITKMSQKCLKITELGEIIIKNLSVLGT